MLLLVTLPPAPSSAAEPPGVSPETLPTLPPFPVLTPDFEALPMPPPAPPGDPLGALAQPRPSGWLLAVNILLVAAAGVLAFTRGRHLL